MENERKSCKLTVCGVHEYNTVINSDRQKTRSNINDVRLNYLFFTLWHSQFQFRYDSSYLCMNVNFTIHKFKKDHNFIQVFFLIFYCTGLKFSAKHSVFNRLVLLLATLASTEIWSFKSPPILTFLSWFLNQNFKRNWMAK